MKKTWIIYQHVCNINGKSYIGITSQKPNYRWSNGKGYRPKNQALFANAIKKYGWENFSHIILESGLTLAQANKREQYWIAYYHTWVYDPECNGYNITKGGDGTLGHKVSDEAKKRMSEAKKGKPGHKLSEEKKQKLSLSKQICGNGHNGKKYVNNGIVCYCISINDLQTWLDAGFVLGRLTSEHAHKNMSKKILCVELNRVFDSLTQAAAELNLQVSKISCCCHGTREKTGGYHFKFINGPKKRG